MSPGIANQVIWRIIVLISVSYAADDDYNIVHKDGSFQFGYTNPDSYHFADANRNNVVRGEFGERNPKTGAIDSVVYTAGPRGFRPRGKNIHRKYDLNQNGPRAIGSPDDPYYDPYEDPSYNYAFNTRTYSKQEAANRVGDVAGKYTYLDDVGERHNVEYIAGKKTGFHVKTPFPDSNPRAYGPLYFRGRGRPIPRGRTSIQRGLDGSYKFVSAGPDQRRTEVSDSTNHVRGSYTYLDDKGVQHSVHYIAGPETGYRVLKTVKGPHLPTVYPFDTPDIIPPDFYAQGGEADLFDTAASGRPYKPGRKPSRPRPADTIGNGIDVGKEDYDKFGGEKEEGVGLTGEGALEEEGGPSDVPGGGRKPGQKPFGRPEGSLGGGTTGPSRPGSTTPGGLGLGGSDEDGALDFGDLFGEEGSSTTGRPGGGILPTGRPGGAVIPSTSRPGGGTPSTGRPGGGTPSNGRPTGRPTITTFRPTPRPGIPQEEDDGSYKPEQDGYTSKPGSGSTRPPYPGGSTTAAGGSGSVDYNDVYYPDVGGGGDGGGGVGGDYGDVGVAPCISCPGTIVRNVGHTPFRVPPGGYARAHVQSIDLYPYYDWAAPSKAYKSSRLNREQLNEASESRVEESTTPKKSDENLTKSTTVAPPHQTTPKSKKSSK